MNLSVDLEPPSIQCPDDIFVDVYTGNISSPVSWDPIEATDNSGQEVQILGSHTSGDIFTVGSTAVIFTGIDESGNGASCTFSITLEGM